MKFMNLSINVKLQWKFNTFLLCKTVKIQFYFTNIIILFNIKVTGH